MSYFDDASLVMIPSGYKTSKVYSVKPTDGSGDLTFSRSNDTATRVNSAGLIEKVRTNLVLQSETFNNASWAKTFGASITANTAANPLTGTQTADTIYADATNDFHYISQSITYSAGEATISVYLKANGYSWFVIDSGFSNAFGYFNLTTGAVGTKGSACTTAITSVGSGWYRCSVTFTATASASSVFLSIRNADNGGSFLGDGVGGFFIYGAQAEMGVATSYIATTSAAVSVGPVANVPRLDYLGSTCPKLLLEPQRTNLATYSEQFNNAAWFPQNTISVTANTAVGPDGYTNADTLEKTGGSGGTNYYYVVRSITSNTINTFSVFAKYKTGSGIIWLLGKDSGYFAYFNLQTGTALSASAGMTTKIENYGNGWYRCSFTQDYTGASDYTLGVGLCLVNGTPNYNATTAATQGAYIYGAQFEAGAYATSYIPTLGAAVTRGADACYKDSLSVFGTNVGSFFVDAEGPFFDGNAAYLFDLSDNSSATVNRFAMYSVASNTMALFTNGSTNFTASVTARKKIAVIWNGTNTKVYLNGAKVVDITYANANPTSINLNSRFNDTEYGNSKYNQVLAFPTALSDADAISLTTL